MWVRPHGLGSRGSASVRRSPSHPDTIPSEPELGGEDSNLDSRHQKPLSCQLNDPRRSPCTVAVGLGGDRAIGYGEEGPLRCPTRMGSLIKKRRKRMRKKKHKKMLKRTRFQRRNKEAKRSEPSGACRPTS